MAFRSEKSEDSDRGMRLTVETYSTKSVGAGDRMARVVGDNARERAEFARVLVEDSKQQGSSISMKNNRITRRAG